ncbi:putative 1-phosphatidylinositol-3-phosphate 5-kinase FAB1D [Platanthera guangdongensis]|uniref:1-phosphatidylinositol-3-phosphate 5-kinase FAB1D n=1 Tax=Platanthera guangdongensis TaxID=2320717 RepID=A0ABR2MS90_9ASPA
MNQSCSFSSSDLSRMLMSSFSASLRKLLSENGLRPITSEYISSFFGLKEEDHDHPSSSDLTVSSSTGTIDDEIEANVNIAEEKLNHDPFNNGSSEALSTSNEHVQSSIAVNTNKTETECKDDSDGVLSPESILVLLSSQRIEKGIVCEQSHLSRIKYYGNFDVSLGRYLQDVLLNQKHACSSCGEPPEVHIYCYTHQNGNLTVLVKQLPSSSSLSGELEGKIWMWSRCLKCEHESGIPRSTKRVVMSTAARSLSFGKFLELSFTSHSAASRLSSECGHSLHRDCLRFFGLGSRVAMFRYSPVEIYAACKPPPVLEFANPNEQDWVVQEAKSVIQRGDAFFSEVANFLLVLKTSSSDTLCEQNCNFQGFVRSICKAENMLMQESLDISSTTENGVLTAAVDFTNEVKSMECSRHNDTSGMMIETIVNGSGLVVDSVLKRQHSSAQIFKNSPNFEDPESLIWVPFSELRNAYKRDLNGGYLHKFLFVRTYTPKYLSPMHQLFPEERGLLHFPVGAGGNIMSVREDEISSIIACALALSEDQKDVLVGKMEADREINDPSILASEGSVASSYYTANGSFDSAGIHPSRSFQSLPSDELSNSVLESTLSLDRLLTPENLHPQIPLGMKEGLKKYSVVCIHAKQFHTLRKMCCPSEQVYISSLSRCRKWDAQGGKSKAFFAKSMDDRFIIKQIKKAELDSFLKFAQDYFEHIIHSLSMGSQTCLAKILGIYQVRITRSGKEVKIDLMVMENLLFGRNVTRTYDLKGALFSRYVTDGNDPEKVLLDQNFVEDMRLSPIYVGGRTKHLLQRAVWNDTAFLNAINVMDYSLLVGVDKKQQHMVFGIIDYLRQYTLDKQLEAWVKSSLVVPKNSSPTIISPKEYKKRFRKFLSRYFLTVPDSWCSSECPEPCKFCVGGSRNLSGSHSSDPGHREL